MGRLDVREQRDSMIRPNRMVISFVNEHGKSDRLGVTDEQVLGWCQTTSRRGTGSDQRPGGISAKLCRSRRSLTWSRDTHKVVLETGVFSSSTFLREFHFSEKLSSWLAF